MDEIDPNKAGELLPEGMEQPSQEESIPSEEKPSETGGQETAEPSKTDVPKEESFLPDDEKSRLEADLKEHPEWRPFIEEKLKDLQAGFTKAMQKVPVKYRDPAYLKSLEDKANLYDKLDKDPAVVKLINEYMGNVKKDKKAESKGQESDFAKTFKENLTDEQKSYLDWFEPYLQHMISQAVKPMVDETNTTKEQMAQKDLEAKYGDKYDIDIMDPESWQTIMEMKANHPTLSYDECLFLCVKEIYPEELEKTKPSVTKPQTKDQVVIGSARGEGSETGRYTQEQLDAMSPEQYARAMNLQYAPER